MKEQDLQKCLGKQIARFRKESGLTQEQLGDRVGVNWKTVGKIERGESFTSLSTLYRISSALGHSLDELFLWAPKRRSKADEDSFEVAIAFIRELAQAERAFTVEDAAKLLAILARRGGKLARTIK